MEMSDFAGWFNRSTGGFTRRRLLGRSGEIRDSLAIGRVKCVPVYCIRLCPLTGSVFRPALLPDPLTRVLS